MRDERIRILKMVEEGKITAEDAERLLSAIEKNEGKKARWLKVRIWEEGKEVFKINIPISLLKSMVKLGERFVSKDVEERLKKHGVDISSLEDIEEVLDTIDDNVPYKLIECEDEDEGIEIIIE